MAKIKIEDLPKDLKISKEEMRTVHGGWTPYESSDPNSLIFRHTGAQKVFSRRLVMDDM